MCAMALVTSAPLRAERLTIVRIQETQHVLVGSVSRQNLTAAFVMSGVIVLLDFALKMCAVIIPVMAPVRLAVLHRNRQVVMVFAEQLKQGQTQATNVYCMMSQYPVVSSLFVEKPALVQKSRRPLPAE